MCQLRSPGVSALQRYSILNQILSSNQTLYYKVSRAVFHNDHTVLQGSKNVQEKYSANTKNRSLRSGS